MAFASPLDLFTLMARASESTDEEFARAALLLDIVTAEMKAEMGQQIEEGTATVTLAGTYARDLELPQRPVTAVTSVSQSGLTLAAGSWTWNDRGLIRRGALYADDVRYDDDYEFHAQGATYQDGGHWGGPTSTVTVTYTYGLEDIPDDLRGMCLRVAMRQFSNPDGVRSEQLGAYSVTYPDDSSSQGSTLYGTGVLTGEERRTLRRRYGRVAGTIYAG